MEQPLGINWVTTIFKALQDCLRNKQHTHFVLLSFLFSLSYGGAMRQEPSYFDNPDHRLVMFLIQINQMMAGFTLPVTIVAKCEEKIFLAQKKFNLAKTSGEKKFSSPKIGILISPIWAILCHLIAN